MIAPLLTLLFAQQAGGMHALGHALAKQGQDQQDKHAPYHPAACGQCAAYTELGSALNGTVSLLLVIAVIVAIVSKAIFILRTTQPLAVVARGPPAFLRTFV